MLPAIHSSRPTPDLDYVVGGVGHASCSGVPVEMTTAFAQIMSSLKGLANDCRNRGLDPVTMLTMVLGGAGSAGGGVAAASQAPAMPPVINVETLSVPPPVPMPSDTELTKRSHDLIDALDRGDVAALDAALAPSFVGFKGGPPTTRDPVLAALKQRESCWYIAKRTWDNEQVVRKNDALVFTGRAHEVQGGNDTHGGYLYVSWYLLQWVRVDDAWRVQLLTSQREFTYLDWWNETFHTGRGFSLEPNRLLVETVEGKKPGAALDLAMGQGRNALYLASQGWRVTGVDNSDEGLRIAREQAVKCKLTLEAINADIDEWDFGVNRFDLVTLLYAGDHAKWIDKIKASLCKGGLFIVEGWAKDSPDSPVGFGEGQLAKLFDGYEILRDEIVEDVPDWAWDKGKLARFVARKK